MSDVFVDFIETDQLIRIYNVHKMHADQCDETVNDERCIKLVEMAFITVDFSKIGILVDIIKMLRHSRFRSHFMALGLHVEIMKDKLISFDEVGLSNRNISDDDNDSTGRFFNAFNITAFSTLYMESIGLRYEGFFFDIMFESGLYSYFLLSGVEVYIGDILGKTGALMIRQRELCISIKVRFADILSITVEGIGSGEYDHEDKESKVNRVAPDQALELSIACLWVALNEEANIWKSGKNEILKLRSFGYVAAAVLIFLWILVYTRTQTRIIDTCSNEAKSLEIFKSTDSSILANDQHFTASTKRKFAASDTNSGIDLRSPKQFYRATAEGC
ncbi:hypothetical protein B0O99DRAFT_595531 [Bisporella sp. PMI_857]|nr:hypothetical protein B0O99DRAFT_595531 [Bisporella sp. PMI_857]